MQTASELEDAMMDENAVIEEALLGQAFKEQAKIIEIKRNKPS